MIQLTRLNGHLLYVNPDLIKFIESAPDTVLTLTSGEKIVVREDSKQVLQQIIAYRRQLASQAAPPEGQQGSGQAQGADQEPGEK
jgi:flagellar protein FlbD